MGRRIINNNGVYNENQHNEAGSNTNNAGRDIRITKNETGLSVQEFQTLLGQIQSQVRTVNLARSEREDIEAIVAQVLRQTQKKEPDRSLIVDPLNTAFKLIRQARGVTANLAHLLQKAIHDAQELF